MAAAEKIAYAVKCAEACNDTFHLADSLVEMGWVYLKQKEWASCQTTLLRLFEVMQSQKALFFVV